MKTPKTNTKNTPKQKAQGTIEYLVIIAIVVVIALIVVSLLINQTNNANTTNEQTSKLYWTSQELAITDSQTDNNGNLLIVLKNNTSEPNTIQTITINETTIYPDNFTLHAQETKTLYLNKPQLGATTNNTITLTYTTQNGLTKNQTGTTNLITQQTTTINPTPTVLLLTQNNCFDWNASATQHTICTCDDLNTIDYNTTTRGWTYILQNNIDFRNCDPNYTTGNGWNPIGSFNYPFTGTFLGNNKTISGLFINRPDTNYVGLFGYMDNADINDLGILNQNVVGFYDVGGLIGYSYNNSKINNCYTTGTTTSTGNYVGGLAGINGTTSTISNSYTTGNVTGVSYVGGLTGYNSSSSIITNSYASGNTTGTGSYTGGLVGRNNASAKINYSYATGNTTGATYTSGLVGYNSTAEINNSYSTGNTTGSSNYTGGLVGYNYSSAQINSSYTTGNTTGTGTYTGGLAGANGTTSTISNSYTTGNVMGVSQVGGLTGYNYNNSKINNSYSTGNIKGTSTYVGGLAGRSYISTITNSYSTGAVEGTSYPGGLVGYNDTNSQIFNSFSTGTVIGTSNVQGVVGYNPTLSSVINLYWYDSNASDNATTCYQNGDANCTKLLDANYSLLFDPTTDLYDTNQPFWTFGNDKNWTARTDNYPILSWQPQ